MFDGRKGCGGKKQGRRKEKVGEGKDGGKAYKGEKVEQNKGEEEARE